MSNTADQRNQQEGGRASSDTHGERFRHGLHVYTRMTANAYCGGLNPALADLEQEFPFLVDAAMSFAIGEVWDRPQLAPKSRDLAMIAALAALGSDGYARLQPDFDQYGPGLERLFEGREQPPQAVADEVARVLAIPRGNKPLRTEVDFSEWGAGVCNAVAEYETARLWGNMGLGHLLHVSLGQHQSGERP